MYSLYNIYWDSLETPVYLREKWLYLFKNLFPQNKQYMVWKHNKYLFKSVLISAIWHDAEPHVFTKNSDEAVPLLLHYVSISYVHFQIEAGVIRHTVFYLVNCVRIVCSSKKIMVLGSPQVFDERIILWLFFKWFIPFRC